VAEYRLHDPDVVPECTTREWYAGRDHAPHLEQPTHRARLLAAAEMVVEAARLLDARTVVDLGSGDGGLLSLLGPPITGWGYDLQPTNVAAARLRGVDVKLVDILTDPITWGEIAVATELLEHLRDPHGLVARAARHSRALVCSSPCEETPEVHYEHHVWAWDVPGFAAMVTGGGWWIVHHRTVGATQIVMAIR
jgi:SAM-dependent methyltransferase